MIEILNSPFVIIIFISGASVILVGLLIIILPTETRTRIDQFVNLEKEIASPVLGGKLDRLGGLRSKINNALSILASETLRIKLTSGHWKITDKEFVLLRAVFTIISFSIGWFLPGKIIMGIGLALITYALPSIILNRSLEIRRVKFQNQILDALVLIRGAIQSGYSVLQSLDFVRDEMPEPASDEFGRVIREVQLGIPLNRALQNLADRMANDDLTMVVTSMIINSEVGGNLTTMLTAVTNTIRARIFLFGEIRALTSYARYAGYFLTLLPFFTGIVLFIANPDYFSTVSTSLLAQIILFMAALAMIIGNVLLRRITKIKY